jgi:hypothetical protein
MSPNGGRGGKLRGLCKGVQLNAGAPINFVDLTPFLIYGKNLTNGPRARFYQATVALTTINE